MTIWVVVADSSRGRIYAQDEAGSPLREMFDLVHTGARLHGTELTSDRAGGHAGTSGTGTHALDARTAAKQHEAETFAREIAVRLEAGRTGGLFQHLVLVAPPAFLGELRGQLDAPLRRLVTTEVAKDLVMYPTDELRARLLQAT